MEGARAVRAHAARRRRLRAPLDRALDHLGGVVPLWDGCRRREWLDAVKRGGCEQGRGEQGRAQLERVFVRPLCELDHHQDERLVQARPPAQAQLFSILWVLVCLV